MSAMPLPPNVAELTGAIFFGNLFNFMLMGALFVQGFYYYQSFSGKDRLFIQLFPAAALVIETLQTIMVTIDGYQLFCVSWGTPEILLTTGRIWLYAPVLGSLMAFIAQCFYAWRIHLLTRKFWISGTVVLISLAQFIAGIVTAVIVVGIHDVRELSKSENAASVWLAGSAAADLIIATSMLYFLGKSRTGFKRTDTLISQIIQVSLETGLLCSMVAIIDLIVFLQFKDKNWHLCIGVVISKLYANSLLTVLNSRARISASLDAAGVNTQDAYQSVQTAPRSTAHASHRPNFTGSHKPPFQVEVSVAHEIHKDGAIHVPMVDVGRANEDKIGPLG